MQNHVLVNLFNANGLRPKLWVTERDAGDGGGIVGARFRGRWSPGCCGSDYDPPTYNRMAEACLPPGQKKSSHIWLGCLRNQTEYPLSTRTTSAIKEQPKDTDNKSNNIDNQEQPKPTTMVAQLGWPSRSVAA
ncbi:hypothetical protein ACLKA7_009960 [Drosophila subpalustris]